MNQINVHDKAHELARALKSSDQYTTLVQMKAQVDEVPELAAMLKDFNEKNTALQAEAMMTGKMNEEALEEVKKLYAIVMANPLANMYLQSELAFSQLINDIGAILGEVINSVQK